MKLWLTLEQQGLNCVVPLICGLFSKVNSAVLPDGTCGWLNLQVWNHR